MLRILVASGGPIPVNLKREFTKGFYNLFNALSGVFQIPI